MTEIIEQLTPEQEALIPVYREKWRKIALSTEPCDRQKAADAVNATYELINLPKPNILFFDSPFAVMKIIYTQKIEDFLKYKRQNVIRSKLRRQIEDVLWHDVDSQICRNNWWKESWFEIESQLELNLALKLNKKQAFTEKVLSRRYLFKDCIKPVEWNYFAILFDLGINRLNFKYDSIKWEILQALLKNCGWIFPYEKTCFICDRPRILCFDTQQRLHAEASPAIKFADGFSVYAYHGVRLPEEYGKIHPNQWPSQWLLSENNAELRRVLIQGIGYDRICSELPIVKLDTWQEYDWLKIDLEVDLEPIYLLKMTCPSTDFIHVLRVPPDMKSAREAITWINWGITPEDFSVQT